MKRLLGLDGLSLTSRGEAVLFGPVVFLLVFAPLWVPALLAALF